MLELTHDINALLPLLVACTAAYAVTVLLLKRSILTEKVARRGHHLTREYIIDPFEITRVGEVMVRGVDTLSGDMGIDDAVRWFSTETTGDPAAPHLHKSYPVVDEDGGALGMVSRADALRWLTKGWPPGATLADIAAGTQPFVGYADELVGQLADRMAVADVGRVPIVRRSDGKLVGIIARKDLLQVRARMLAQEQERERRPLLRSAARGRARRAG